jgi:hypothetical protein
VDEDGTCFKVVSRNVSLSIHEPETVPRRNKRSAQIIVLEIISLTQQGGRDGDVGLRFDMNKNKTMPN